LIHYFLALDPDTIPDPQPCTWKFVRYSVDVSTLFLHDVSQPGLVYSMKIYYVVEMSWASYSVEVLQQLLFHLIEKGQVGGLWPDRRGHKMPTFVHHHVRLVEKGCNEDILRILYISYHALNGKFESWHTYSRTNFFPQACTDL
jgi:hypothetical protein